MHITFGANEFKFAFYWCEWRSIAHLLWCKGFQMCVFLVQMEIKFALASYGALGSQMRLFLVHLGRSNKR